MVMNLHLTDCGNKPDISAREDLIQICCFSSGGIQEKIDKYFMLPDSRLAEEGANVCQEWPAGADGEDWENWEEQGMKEKITYYLQDAAAMVSISIFLTVLYLAMAVLG